MPSDRDREGLFREYLSDGAKSELKHDILELAQHIREVEKRQAQTELQSMHRHAELMLVNEATSHRINAVIQELKQLDGKTQRIEKDVETTGQHRVQDILAKTTQLEESNKDRLRFWLKLAATTFGVILAAVIGHFLR